MQKTHKFKERTTETQYYIQMENQYGAAIYAPLDVVIRRGEGIWVEDVEGKRYMDFLSAYYVSELESLLGRQSQRLTVYTRQCHLWCFRLDDPLRNRQKTRIYVTHSEIELSPTEQHPEHSELNLTIGLALLSGESNIFTIFSPIGSETIQ